MKLVNGQRYRYSTQGELRTHRGLIGTLSGVQKRGASSFGWLSNVREWGALGICTSIEVVDRELTPVAEEAAEKSPKTTEGRFVGMESDLVALIEFAAQSQGYKVGKVGQARAKGSGTTVGYPDMSFRRPEWPRGMVCLIEVKTAEGTLSKEQLELHAEGWSYVAYSVDEALEHLQGFENRWRLVQ